MVISMIGIFNVFMVNNVMFEEFVYKIIKLLFEKVEDLWAIYLVADDIIVEFSLESMFILFYLGVIRYYEEVGVMVLDYLCE